MMLRVPNERRDGETGHADLGTSQLGGPRCLLHQLDCLSSTSIAALVAGTLTKMMSANDLEYGSCDIFCLPHAHNCAQQSNPDVARARLCSRPFERVEAQLHVL
jgi:hypothetical protein